MRIHRAAIAAIAVTGALAQPASALERHSYANAQSQDGHTVSMNGLWQVQAGDDGTADIAFECYANTAPFAAAAGFKDCYLEGADGTRHRPVYEASNPGSWTAAGNVVQDTKAQPYRICMRVAAFWRDDNYGFTTSLTCSSLR